MQIKGWIFMFFCSGWLAVGNLDKSDSKSVTDDHTPRSEILPRIRKSRFLTFNNDESTLRVELNFAVPFLQIPIRGHKAVESGSNNQYPLIDVNAKSLITASALLFMLVFIIPKVIRIFLPHIMANHLPKESRSENKITNLMYDIESAMSALKIDADACWQRTVCFAVQNSVKNVDNKEGSSWDKIIDGVARNDFLLFLADGSSTYQAMRLGLTENECSRMYKSCNFDMKGILSLIKKIPLQSLT